MYAKNLPVVTTSKCDSWESHVTNRDCQYIIYLFIYLLIVVVVHACSVYEGRCFVSQLFLLINILCNIVEIFVQIT